MLTPEEPRISGDQPITSGAGERKLQLVLPSLIPPLPGAFDDTFFDYFINPDGFKVAMQFRMETDNPALIGMLEESPFLPDSDLPYKWACIYYGMFERAAKKQGLPPLNIPAEAVIRYTKTQALVGMSGLANEAIAKEIDEWERRKTRDRELSPELAKFWDFVESDILSVREEERSESYVLNLLLPVTTIQTLLQRQQDEYSLLKTYSLNQPRS